MPEKETLDRARRDKRQGKAPSTQAGEFVREENIERETAIRVCEMGDSRLSAIDQLWVADITYIRLELEFIYLAVVLDAFSRRVIGWALDRTLEDALTLSALGMALKQRQPKPGLVHHSDRGVQYASADYTGLLNQHGIGISMSRTGNPYDNAYASHCTSLEHSGMTVTSRRREGFLPCSFRRLSWPGGSYRHSGLPV
jgi:transposase InsO family protein